MGATKLMVRSLFNENPPEDKEIVEALYPEDRIKDTQQHELIEGALYELIKVKTEISNLQAEARNRGPYRLEITLSPTGVSSVEGGERYSNHWKEFSGWFGGALTRVWEALDGLKACLSILKAFGLFREFPSLFLDVEVKKVGTRDELTYLLYYWPEGFFERGEDKEVELSRYLVGLVAEHFDGLLTLRDELLEVRPQEGLQKHLTEAARKMVEDLERQLREETNLQDALVRNSDLLRKWSVGFLKQTLHERARYCRENCVLTTERLSKLISKILSVKRKADFPSNYAKLFEQLCCQSSIFEVAVVRLLAVQGIPVLPDVLLAPIGKNGESKQFDFLIPVGNETLVVGDITASRNLGKEFCDKSKNFVEFRENLPKKLRLYYAVVGLSTEGRNSDEFTSPRDDIILIRLEPERVSLVLEELMYALSKHYQGGSFAG